MVRNLTGAKRSPMNKPEAGIESRVPAKRSLLNELPESRYETMFLCVFVSARRVGGAAQW